MTVQLRNAAALALAAAIFGYSVLPAPGAAQGSASRPDLVIRRGSDEFGFIRSVAADNQGRIYAADEYAGRILVFDSTGQQVRTIGNKGRGPGEFGRLYSVTFQHGKLWALDPGNARIQAFDIDGAPAQTVRWQAATGSSSIVRFYQTAEDDVYVRRVRVTGTTVETHFVRLVPDRLADSLLVPNEFVPGSVMKCDIPGGFTTFQVPFAPQRLVVPAPRTRVAVAMSNDLKIAFISSTGDTLGEIRHNIRAAQISDEDWARATEKFRDFRSKNPGSKCDTPAMRRPKIWPLVVGLFFDEQERTYVETPQRNMTTWSVYDRQGQPLARFQTAVRDSRVPPYFLRRNVYLVLADADGVQRIERYKTP